MSNSNLKVVKGDSSKYNTITQEEKEYYIYNMYIELLKKKTKKQIENYLRSEGFFPQFKSSIHTFNRLFKEAKKRLKASYSMNYDIEFTKARKDLELLWIETIKAKDWRNALAVRRELSETIGLKKAQSSEESELTMAEIKQELEELSKKSGFQAEIGQKLDAETVFYSVQDDENEAKAN